MSWTTLDHSTSSQEGVAASSPTFCLDTYLSGLARSTKTQETSCCNVNKTTSSRSSQSGTKLPLLMAPLGEGTLTSSAEGSPVKISAPKEQTTESSEVSTETAQVFGLSIADLSERCDLSLSLRRTPRSYALADLSESSKTLPVWGMMQDGVVSEVAKSEQTIGVNASGLLPTPLATDWKGGSTAIRKDKGRQRFDQWRDYVKIMFGMTYPHPTHSELRMGWPEGWTELAPLATAKFQQWRALHGSCSPADSWKKVSYAADCIKLDPSDEEGEECSICGDFYPDCPCPGPTQEGYEYKELNGELYARVFVESGDHQL